MSLFALSRWPWLRRWFGDRSERAAEQFLRRLGYRILARNYSCPPGELDLVALDSESLVFVEVRSTASSDELKLAQSIDLQKQRRLTQAALHFLQHHRLMGKPSRFDVILIRWPADGMEPTIRHFPGAFEAVGRFQMDY